MLSEEKKTYGVARLLHKYLREADHLSVIFELLGEVDHSIRRVLLIAFVSSSQERHEGCLRDRLAFIGTTSRSLL